jgi:hypothetical protein
MITFKTTSRGFRLGTFKDRYGEISEIQESSLADEAAIWLGCRGRVEVGPPWEEYKLPDNAVMHSRMHLTQDMVRELLPLLQYFVDTGVLPNE